MTLRTFLGKSPKDIQHHLRRFVDYNSGSPSVCIFTFSAHEGADWGGCWSEILRLEEAGHRTLGCIASPRADASGSVSCSVGLFNRRWAIPFRSTIRGNEVISVGKWHSFEKAAHNVSDTLLDSGSLADGRVSWDEIWQQGQSAEVTELMDLKNIRREDVSSLVYFTDKAHQGLTRSLLHYYPAASKLGLFGPSTLTINERPLTMMWGNSIVSDGAVGLAFLNTDARLDVQFGGVRPITGSMQVTASTGNIVESVNNTNPTRLLLQALESSSTIDASGMASYASIQPLLHESVFLGTVDPSSGAPTKMYKITAGDPSRGPLSLEVGRAPLAGQSVQFFVPEAVAPQSSPAKSRNTMDFMTVAEGEHLTEEGAGEVTVLEDAFLAASDAGLLVHRPGEDVECMGVGGPVGTRAQVQL